MKTAAEIYERVRANCTASSLPEHALERHLRAISLRVIHAVAGPDAVAEPADDALDRVTAGGLRTNGG